MVHQSFRYKSTTIENISLSHRPHSFPPLITTTPRDEERKRIRMTTNPSPPPPLPPFFQSPTPVAAEMMNVTGGVGVGVGPQKVLITGVSKGLGRALAVEISKRGHIVIGCSRSQDKIDSLRTQLRDDENRHLLMSVDIRSDTSVADFAKQVIHSKGLLPDIIGTINKNNKIWEVPAEEFDAVMDTNIKGIANVLRHFLPPMVAKKKGIVVNMSSGWGRSAAAEVAPYCASKWAIEGLTRSVAKELPDGMAIIALSPGVVNTEMLVSCFGSSASAYQTPETWAPKAATMILNLTRVDNGASLTV